MVAHELLQCLKSRIIGMNHALAFKLDMNQVFDKVKWSFLKAMMAKLGSSD